MIMLIKADKYNRQSVIGMFIEHQLMLAVWGMRYGAIFVKDLFMIVMLVFTDYVKH